MSDILFKELSYKINGVLFAAHNKLGQFSNEKQYADLIEQLFKQENIGYNREQVLPPSFQGERSGRNKVDFLIEDTVILELKAKQQLENADFAQTLRYLTALEKKLGILVNFKSKYLKIRRVLNSKSNELSYPPNLHISKSASFAYPCMKVKIKRVDTSLPLPAYQTAGAVAFDLYSREDMIIKPKTIALVPTNIIVEVPKGYMLTVVTRSSTPKKKGLLVPHGIGIIDQDYHGAKDEIMLQMYNFTDQDATITRGERVGQAAFVRVDRGEWEEVDEAKSDSRGGFGSTG